MIRMQTFPKQGKCLGSQAPDCYHFNAPHRLLLVQQHMMVLFISFSFHTATLLASETAVWFVPLDILNYCALNLCLVIERL